MHKIILFQDILNQRRELLISLVNQKNMGIPIIFALFNLIVICGKSYVVVVDADRRRIETQKNVVIDDRSWRTADFLARVGAYVGLRTNGN